MGDTDDETSVSHLQWSSVSASSLPASRAAAPAFLAATAPAFSAPASPPVPVPVMTPLPFPFLALTPLAIPIPALAAAPALFFPSSGKRKCNRRLVKHVHTSNMSTIPNNCADGTITNLTVGVSTVHKMQENYQT